ncbi:hypothetical protein [Candidatus Uabimicrobium amorphum]|uniref:Uncharacterized protein n=1 Tax=Uabimicrobium amorphum TaxID=2596890 RepID=A0A5S9II78_UABAM|nr:hypothetical protein [Candidatus Uabimicrobium amorphum]BBM82308.1 hypothetical protein UABAM_00651 [Candidatus Uabimicrobium amorphum]
MRLFLFVAIAASFLYADIEVHRLIENQEHDPVFWHIPNFADHSKRNYAALSPQGNLGIVYRTVERINDRGKKKYTVFFHDITTNDVQAIYSKATYKIPKMNLSLIYDHLGKPHIFVDYTYRFIHFYRKDSKWIKDVLPIKFRRIYGSGVNSAKIYHIVEGENQRLYVVFFVMVKLKYHLLFAEYSQKKWQLFEVEDIPKDMQKIFDVQIRNLEDFTLLYGGINRLMYANFSSGTWDTETVVSGKKMEQAGWEANIFRNKDKLYVASNIRRVVSTGSLVFSRLLWSERSEKGWETKVIFRESRGYSGKDGQSYTGASPCIFFDDEDRANVIFNDVASWHSGGVNDFCEGNLRHAVRKGKSWKSEILYPQIGQWHKPQPLYELLYPVVFYVDGRAHCFGVERVTEGISTRFGGKNPMGFSIVYIIFE